jgi:hypothetical protein
LKQTTMTKVNLEYLRGQSKLTANQLHEACQYYVDLHNYDNQNYKTGQEIIVLFKDRHFLLGDGIFVVTFSDLYDLFNIDTLDISNALLHIVSPQKLASSLYVLYVSNKFGILRVGTCNNKIII